MVPLRNFISIRGSKNARTAASAAAFFMLCSVQTAIASTAVPVVEVPSGATNAMQYAIAGHITARCSLETTSPSVNLGDILDPANGAAVSRRVSVPITYQCNAPFDASVTSLNGGLRFQGLGVANFADLVSYSMAIDLQAAGAITLNCTATQMKGDLARGDSACHASSAPGTGLGGARTELVIATTAGTQPLLQGAYSDVISIRLTPRISS